MKEQQLLKIEKKLGNLDSLKDSDVKFKAISLKKLNDLLTGFEFQNLIEKIRNKNITKRMTYSLLSELQDSFDLVSTEVRKTKEDIDFYQFQMDGNVFDFKKLKQMFKDNGLKKRYPNFNFKRYEELIKNPVLEIKNFEGVMVPYDSFVVRKIMIAIHQMVFSEMDFRIINTGKEGAGKSCWASQLILYIHWFLTEIGLIKYDFEVTKLFFSSLETMLGHQERQDEADYFRLFCLDEGYELNRMNYREEGSLTYKDSMRSDRKMLRIEIINLPQMGELETAITLTRTNFIFYSDMSSDIKTGTVKKGDNYMYILPRGKYVYSPYQRRNVTDKEIINTLSRILKDKNDSYKGLPESMLIHKFRTKGIWGFDKIKYDSYIKNENKKKRMRSFIKMSDRVGYILFQKLPKISLWGSFDMKKKNDKAMYHLVQKFLKKDIGDRYMKNDDLRTAMERHYNVQEERNALKKVKKEKKNV